MLNIKDLLQSGPLYLDGATGTNLQKAGMPAGVCPEAWMIENAQVLTELQRGYAAAGSDIVYAPTFSGNRIKLDEYGLGGRIEEINRTLVRLTKAAVGDKCFVAGNLTMTGQAIEPVGTLPFETLVDCYKEQVRIIADEGVDLFVIETMMNLGETRAALLAVKEETKLPVFVTISLDENGRTLYGTDPAAALVSLEALGADAFGINCSAGPDRLGEIVKRLDRYAGIPLIVKPNAGMPKLLEGQTVYDMPAAEFVREMKKLVAAGASILGGCCGTDASYIKLLKQETAAMNTVFTNTDRLRHNGRRLWQASARYLILK
ncbi:MAG: homocysteine S-methyltransferase family protein [Catenibacillus sp.]|nr:homocysteine S-methyltransferase family protein [Catenibacillus sp.]